MTQSTLFDICQYFRLIRQRLKFSRATIASRAEDVLDLIGAASVRRGATLIMSLHQPDLARRYADRIIALRSGSVVFDGPPDELTAEQQARIYDRKRITPLPQGADQRA